MSEGEAEGRRFRTVYGRRRGRKLRVGQQALKETLLPELSFALPETGELDPATLFPEQKREVWLEIGFGGGEHLAAQAAAHPEIGLIGSEVFENGIVKLLGEVSRRDLANVRLFADDARLLVARLPEACIGRAFILFPDPWPKQRHHKRRMVSAETLDALARAMRDGAELRLATDDVEYLRWMLERAPAHPDFAWLARRPEDWRLRPADWPQTRYEAKAIAAGRRPAFLRLARRPRAGASAGGQRGAKAP
jgi:tRNA (guanine-N7-)-methyltransferase